jgi:ADP-heptose:LPS heptosyltransferase
MSFRNPRKILAIKIRALGDTVIMTAALNALRRAYPHAEIHAIVSEKWVPLFDGFAAVDRVTGFERNRSPVSRARSVARMAVQLRREKYDWVFNFHASPSSSTLAFATGASVRSIHFHGHRDRNRYSTVTVPGKGVLKPIVERDMDTLRAVGLSVPSGALPEIPVSDSERASARARVEALTLGQPLLGLGIGATRPTKSWALDRFATLSCDWVRKTGGSALAFVAQDELELAHAFLREVEACLEGEGLEERSRIRSRISVEAGLPLRALLAMLAECSVVAGNDSGPKHLAVAVGTPTVTLFGPEHPFEWHPYPRDLHPYFFVENLPCRKDADPGMPPWCGLYRCVEEQHRCMTQIGSSAVLEECLRVAR